MLKGPHNNLIMLTSAGGRRISTPQKPSTPKACPHLALFRRLPENLRQRVNGFESLNIHLQAETLQELRRHTDDVAQVLFAVSVERKIADPRCHDAYATAILKLMSGHLVDCLFHDITINDKNNLVHIANLAKLLMFQKERPNQPPPINMIMCPGYTVKHSRGLVIEPPTFENGNTLKLQDGTEIDINHLITLYVIGADEGRLLDRGPTEIYLGKKVRAWHRGNWQVAEIIDPHGPHDLLQLTLADGHKVWAGKKSIDLDLRDPEATEEKKHPLADFPHIEIGRCVAFMLKGKREIGIISSLTETKFEIETVGDILEFDFEDPSVEFLPLIDSAPTEHLLVKRGNKIIKGNFKQQKTAVYEILGFDPETQRIFTKIVSLCPAFAPVYYYFDLEDTSYTILHEDNTALEKFPALKKDYPSPRIKFHWKGQILEGEVLKTETLPAFVEVIIEKKPEELPSEDGYHRYDVPLNNIIEVS